MELAERIKSLKAAHTVADGPAERLHRKQSSVQESVMEQIRARRDGEE